MAVHRQENRRFRGNASSSAGLYVEARPLATDRSIRKISQRRAGRFGAGLFARRFAVRFIGVIASSTAVSSLGSGALA